MIESILVFSRATPHHHTGGMETLSWSLAAEWARAGREVRLVTTDIPRTSGPFTDEGVTVVPLAGTPSGRYSRAWWDQSRRYWAALDTAPNVALSVSASAYSVVRERSRWPRTPFVMQAHGTSAMEIRSKLRVRDLRYLATTPKNALGLVRDLARYRDFDRIVAVGERVYDSLVAWPQSWAVPSGKVRLIRNGVRAASHGFDARARQEIRAALGIDERATVIGCVGRLHVQKRLDRALRGLAALRERGLADQFRLLLVGDGPDESRLRQLTRELGLADLVRFVGRVDRDSVGRYYAAADVALLTTAMLEVGLPLTVLEALACGLVCVVPTGFVGSAALAGVLLQADPADPGRLADALYAAADPSRPRSSLLPPELTLEHCAQRYLAEFSDLVSVARS